ncbi:MAG: hypothetical protein PUF62_00075 [Bacteroidales bacterium]|nr:hypothetical protein [Bacteroidales bacterium]
MGYNKADYERLITESKLFSLNKETESVAFRKESYKMVEYLYCYLLAQNEKKYEPFGCEITEVAVRCINNYDETKGVFLHYFNAAWKLEYSHLCGNQAVDDRLHGVKITESEKRAIKKYLRYEASLGKDLSRRELCEAIAEILDQPIEVVAEIAELVEYRMVDNEIMDDDGGRTSLFDQLSDGHLVEENLLTSARVEEILTVVESAFLSLQQRQMPIISDMMTIRLASTIAETGVDTSSYSFISEEVLSQYSKNQLPSQRTIAEKCGKNEASISRTVKEFIKKLEILLEQKG